MDNPFPVGVVSVTPSTATTPLLTATAALQTLNVRGYVAGEVKIHANVGQNPYMRPSLNVAVYPKPTVEVAVYVVTALDVRSLNRLQQTLNPSRQT